MATINSIDNDLSNIIKNLKPNEMKQYIKVNVNNLYEAFLKGNEKEALASKTAIEEATKLYISKGYENSLSIELGLRLDKANNLLIDTLTERDNIKYNLSCLLTEDYYNKIYDKLKFINRLFEIISSEEASASENNILVKNIVELISLSSYDIEIFIKSHEERAEENKLYDVYLYELIFSEYEKFKDYYNKFEKLILDS